MRAVSCYGFLFALEAPDQTLEFLRGQGLALVDIEPDSLRESDFRLVAQSGFYDLHQDEDRISRRQPLAVTQELLLIRIHATVSELCQDFTFLRGDALTAASGALILLAGQRFSGQTRLAEALLSRGAKRFSNHFAVIDDSGQLKPYPSQEENASPETVTAIIKVNYQPGTNWQVESISPGRAALALTPLVCGPCELGRALPRLGALAESAGARLLGVRGEADQSAEQLLSARF